MSPLVPKVAFVTGCNGVSGNALVEYLLRQPKEEWSRIVVTSRSSLKNYWQDPRIEFLAIDFLESVDNVVQTMLPYCQDVTHAFFTSYVHTDDFTKLRDLNVPLFETFLTALDTVARESLQRICLQTGGKNYGCHLGPLETPLHEGMPRYKDHGMNFYYTQEDLMFKLHAQRNWSWNVIRPGGIIGFTPSKNGMSEAITLALYFLICRQLGETPRFPGNKYFYNSVDDHSYAVSLADLSVWSSTQEHTKNEAFNHANGDCIVWRYFWKKIGQYWGMDIPDQTTWPELGDEGVYANEFKMAKWAEDKRQVWEDICEQYGGSKEAFDCGTWGFFDWSIGKAWPTIMSISKARKYGWNRYDDTYESWVETFRTFANAGILPKEQTIKARGSVPIETVDTKVSMVATNGTTEIPNNPKLSGANGQLGANETESPTVPVGKACNF